MPVIEQVTASHKPGFSDESAQLNSLPWSVRTIPNERQLQTFSVLKAGSITENILASSSNLYATEKRRQDKRKFDISICLNETDIILDEVKIEPSENLNSIHTFDTKSRNGVIHPLKNNQFFGQLLEVTNDKHYECLNCGKSFKTKIKLYKHTKRHDNIKKYVCKTCSKSFLTSTELNLHIQIHSNYRIHECSVCYKCFKTKQVLREHKKSHSDDKMYKCEICSKSFKLKQYLTQHMIAHSDVKNYECKICSKTYKFKQSLNNHLERHSKLGEVKQEVSNVKEKINDKRHFIGDNIRIKLEIDDEKII